MLNTISILRTQQTIAFALLNTLVVNANGLTDIPNGDIVSLFKAGKATYIIRYVHCLADTLRVPQDLEIHFEGGQY